MSNKNMDPLTKWSCDPPELPSKPVKKLHIYDFDNTLFYSPAPNKMLYIYPTLQQLLSGDHFLTGGWWSDPVPLELLLKISQKDGSLKSCWNPDMIKLAQTSHEQDDTISIILTGRKEPLFKHILLEILKLSRKEDPALAAGLQFNGICLKKCQIGQPTPHTITYKTDLINDFLQYYTDLEEITIYDDRLNQVNGFKKYLNSIQTNFPKLQWFVIPVEPKSLKLPPYVEYLYFQTVLTRHNQLERLNYEGKKRSLYKLQWTKPQYGYFLSLKSYQHLLSRVYKTLETTLLDETTAGYKINITQFKQYPCYIPCQIPNGNKVKQEILYNILTHSRNPNVSNRARDAKVREFHNSSLDSIFNDDSKSKLCKYNFTLKSLGVKIQKINIEEKTVDVHIFIKFQPDEKEQYCYSLYNQFSLSSHIDGDKSFLEGDSFNMKLLNDMIKEHVYYKSCLDDPLVVNTTFGMFSKMKCIDK